MFHETPLCFFIADGGLSLSLNFWLVVAGILIIFLCFLSLFLPNTQTLREKTQEFSGLGVSMKVSIITVFVLMGFILSLSSFAIQWKGYVEQAEDYDENTRRLNERIALLTAQIEEQHKQAKRMRVIDVGVLLRPKFEDGEVSQILKPDEWRCVYRIASAPGSPPTHCFTHRSCAGRAATLCVSISRTLLPKQNSRKLSSKTPTTRKFGIPWASLPSMTA